MMNTKNNQYDWLDRSLYPFQGKTVRLEAGNMHYVDEGTGDTILFVHGTPTWSFLYRNFIKQLSKSYRCIAIDHIGFGLSEKPKVFSGTPQNHARNLSEFIEKLNLHDITLVVHDFGGPIGLGAGIAHAHRIERVVLFNSWLWATKDDRTVQKIDKTINSGLGKFLYLNMNFSPKVLLKKGFANKKNLSKLVHRHYLKPFPNKPSRRPLFHLAQALLGSSDWYQSQWLQLGKLARKPWLILWGTKDEFITTKFLDKWKGALPNVKVKEFDCGHFIQEEKTNESIIEIDNFIKETVREKVGVSFTVSE